MRDFLITKYSHPTL